MNLSKVLIVGGTFDNEAGKASSLMEKLFAKVPGPMFINGGNIETLKTFIKEGINSFDIVFWFANISNEEEKFNNLKELNNKIILVESKRNDFEKYSMKELTWHMLKNKANLTLEFSKAGEKLFRMRILDPLGNEWLNTTDSSIVAEELLKKAEYLSSITRKGTINNITEEILVPEEKDFFELVRKNGETYSDLICPDEGAKQRFLGNASFRSKDNKDLIFMSKRNVNKAVIGKEGFVPVKYDNEKNIVVYSKDKASVDTPVQLALYEELPEVNYMMHAHVYVKGEPFTLNSVPCGGLEEINEIKKVIDATKMELPMIINLVGHGCIILSKDLEGFENLEYAKRELPEIQYEVKATPKKELTAEVISYDMERLHLRVIEGNIDILYRPNHDYIGFVKNDETGKEEIKKLAEMSRDDFKEYLKSKRGRRQVTKESVTNLSDSKAEEWYKSAWKYGTVKFFDELAVINPIEEPIWTD